MLTRMYQRRGTAAQWDDVANSVILSSGEIGIVTDPADLNNPLEGKFKIGNGINVWSALDYYQNDGQNSGIYSKLVATQTFQGSQVVTPSNASTTPLIVSGTTSQSASLQKWRDVNGNALAQIDATGKIEATGGNFLADVEMNAHAITGLKNIDGSSTGSYAVNKQYVDDAIAGLAWKTPVNLVSLATGTDLEDWIDVPLTGNTGTVELDGHDALTQAHGNGYRLLLLNQTTPENDGIWLYTDNGTTYALTRTTDADSFAELKGASVFIQEGDLYGTSSFVQTNHYMADWDEQDWVQFNGASQVNADGGLTKVGNTLAVGAGSGIQVNADNVAIASGGVTSDMIANGTIVNDDINADAEIAPSKIAGTAVTQDDTGTVTSTMIANDTILDIDIHSNAAIDKTKISGTAVTQADSGTVTSTMIANDTIVNADINSAAAIAQSKIANLTTDLNNRSLTSHTHALDDLSDVAITTPGDRHVLKYKGSPVNGWVNELPSGGISVGAVPPSQPAQGDAWFDSTDGSLYVRYDDGVAGNTIAPITPITADTVTSAWTGGYLLKFAYSGTYDAGTSRHTISYSYELTTNSSSWFSGVTLGGALVLDGVTLWSPSGQYSLAQSSTLVLASGTFERSFNSSAVNALSIDASVQGLSLAYPPLKTIVASIPLSTGSVGSSAQWVQVKANSALEASILTRLSAVESRDTKLEAANAVRVANQTERDSVYPAPVQGNTVFRADLGYEEKYYAVYNSSSNPDGTTGTAGWYRYAGGAPLSQNYFINGDMEVNQRGLTSTPLAKSAASYGLDRWYHYLSSDCRLSIQPASITGVPVRYAARMGSNSTISATGGLLAFGQKLESINAVPLRNKTITVSFYIKFSAATLTATTGNYGNFQYQIGYNTSTTDSAFSSGASDSATTLTLTNGSLPTTWTRVSITGVVPATTNNVFLATQFLSSSGYGYTASHDSFYYDVTAVQLEEGPVATPFRRNQPNIQAELAACQRYYYRKTCDGANYASFGVGYADATTSAVFNIPFPVTMRIAPTGIDCSAASTFMINGTPGNGFGGTNGYLASRTSASTGEMYLGVASGLTTNNAYNLAANNTSSAYIGWSAEL